MFPSQCITIQTACTHTGLCKTLTELYTALQIRGRDVGSLCISYQWQEQKISISIDYGQKLCDINRGL
jgi:hypothetical protein